MPVASDKRKVIYTTTTGQTQFSFQTGGTNIPLNAAADLLIKVSTDNYPLNPSLYTVTGSNATGWTLTLLTALPAGSVVTLYRQTTMLNTTDFQENARMFPDTLDATIDRLTMRDIEQQEQLERSMSQSIEDESDAFVFPNRELAKGKFLYFNATTGDMEAQPVSGVYMTLDTPQTVDEVKTFTKSPIVPTPATATEAVNKGYNDDLYDKSQKFNHTGAGFTGDIDTLNDTVVSSKTLRLSTGATNGPAGAVINGSIVTTIMYSASAGIQIYYERGATVCRTFIRKYSSGWGEWYQQGIMEVHQSTGTGRTYTIAAMAVGESRTVLIDMRKSASASCIVALPAGGAYSFHFFAPDSTGTPGTLQLISTNIEAQGTTVAGGTNIRTVGSNTETLQLHGTITRVN